MFVILNLKIRDGHSSGMKIVGHPVQESATKEIGLAANAITFDPLIARR